MDQSIKAVTPEEIRQRGADAFDSGLGIDDHNMNPWVNAVADWRKGWMERRAAVHAAALVKFAMGRGTPP
jgi:hypothetical protein